MWTAWKFVVEGSVLKRRHGQPEEIAKSFTVDIILIHSAFSMQAETAACSAFSNAQTLI